MRFTAMRMMNWILAVSLAAFLAACGGGGSGEKQNDVLNYTGVATQATLSADNAETLALEAYSGRSIGHRVQLLGAGGRVTSPSPLYALSQPMKKSLIQNPVTAGAKALSYNRETRQGECGGQIRYDLNLNDTTGAISGEVFYEDYCSEDVTYDGRVKVEGSYDFQTMVSRLALDFPALSIREESESMIMGGSMEWVFNGDSESLSIDAVLKSENTGEEVWLRDYRVTTTFLAGGIREEISGRFYNSQHGYVDIWTDTPLILIPGMEWPVQGALAFSGAGGGSVAMDFSSSEMLLRADFGGDGIIDWQKNGRTNPDPPPVNHQPIADAGTDQEVVEGTQVTLNGGGYDPEGNTIFYNWSIRSRPAESQSTLSDYSSPNPSFQADRAGIYELGLEVFDGQYVSAIDTVIITVRSEPASDPSMLRLEWKYGTFGTDIGESGLAIADLDGDGTQEIVAGASPSGFWDNSFWYVVRQNTAGSYDQVWSSDPYPSTLLRLAVADADKNGRKEIYLAFADGKVRIVEGGSFQEIGSISVGSSIRAIVIADADGDGASEIVVTDGTQILAYSAATRTVKWASSNGGDTLAVGNVDNDPAPEIVTSTANGHGYVIDGSTRQLQWDYLNGFGSNVGLGDVDGDGREEIVAASGWYKITVHDAEIRTPSWEIVADLDIAALLVTDTDGDGRAEILYGDGQWGSVYCFDGVTRAERWAIGNPNPGITYLAFGDADKDGSKEIVWGGGAGSSGPDYLFIADPATRAIEWQNIHIDGPLSAVDAGDVDDDGRKEIVMVSFESESGHKDGVIHIFDAQTHALEWRSTDLPNIMAWPGVSSVKIGDVDGDGHTEFVLATADLYDGVVQVYDGRTRQLEKSSGKYSGESISSLALGDVDNDGNLEIVAGTAAEHTGAAGIHLLVLNGTSLQEEWRSVDLGGWEGVRDIHLADVDGDGQDEIIAALPDGKVYSFDGQTHQLDGLTDTPAYSIETADLDGNGTMEVLVGGDNGNIQILRGSDLSLIRTASSRSHAAVEALRVDDAGEGGYRWNVGSGGELLVLSSTEELLWRSGFLGDSLGRGNHLLVSDFDGDGRREYLLGSSLALYQYH